MPDTETARPAATSFQEAFQAAKEQVAAQAENPEAPEKGETETATEKPAEQPQAQDQPKEGVEEQILSDEEYEKLKNDPAKLRKALNRAFTQKTQKLASERKQIESYQKLIEGLESDPQETVRFLAERAGLKLAPEIKPEESAAEKAVTAQTPAILSDLNALLGPDNEAFAAGLASVFERHMKEIAKTVAKEELSPLREQQEKQLGQAMAAEAESDLKAAKTRHADWDEHETKIVALSRKYQPPPGSETTAEEYLDMLYSLATMDQVEAKATAKVAAKLAQAAKTGAPQTGVKSDIVAPTPPKKPTIREAFEAAKRGERWE